MNFCLIKRMLIICCFFITMALADVSADGGIQNRAYWDLGIHGQPKHLEESWCEFEKTEHCSTVLKSTMTFNRRGQPLFGTMLFLGIHFEQKITYDDKGRSTGVDSYNKNTQQIDLKKRTLAHDNNGLVKQQQLFNSKGEETVIKNYEYDTKGRLISEILVSPDNGKVILKEIISYDESNHLKTRKLISKSQGTMTFVSKLNDKGLPISEKSYQGEASLDSTPMQKTTYSYQYDTHGNWIKRTSTTDGTATQISTRTITYFSGASKNAIKQ